MDFGHLNQNKNKLVQNLCCKHTSAWFRDMYYVKTIGEAFIWHIHKIVNESTIHQVETTLYTGTDLWKPPKGLRCREHETKSLHCHCLRANEKIISDLLFWSFPYQKRGRKSLSYPETLVRDSDTDITDLVNIMENRNLWKRLVDSDLDCGRRK